MNGFVERPDPMDGMRALALSLEEEDREELGGYVALVLQKLANMNELFLGEKVPRRVPYSHLMALGVAVEIFLR